jgi:hypothetical protein
MNDSPHFKVDLPEAHLKAIGRVAVEWSRLEATIEALIWTALFVDRWYSSGWQKEREGRAVTTHMSFLLRLDALLSLVRIHYAGQPADQDISQLVTDSRALYPERNRVVHGLWAVSDKATIARSYRARGKLIPIFQNRSSESIEELADRIHLLANRAETVCSTLQITQFESGGGYR